MKIRKNQIKEKCLSDKYYAAIKYMSHSLHGKDRENFIITVCDLNIYLGCVCALTCEKNQVVEKHIWKRLNTFFEPKKVKYYDRSTGGWKENVKKLTSKDIANYLLACNVMGNIKAIKWYIYNHQIDKAIIIQLAKNMNDAQIVDLIYTLYRSRDNWQNIRGIGSTKNLYIYKNDNRIKEILKGPWYKDKDAFIQLAYDTGWLSEVGNYYKYKKNIYIDCLVGANKLLLDIELIEDVLSDVDNNRSGCDILLSLILKNENNEKKQFAYLIYSQKINNGYYMTENDYKILKQLGKPCEKIANYFITFFIKLVNEDYKKNINYFLISDALYNVIGKPHSISGKIAKTHNRNLELAIKNVKKIQLDQVLFFYFNTSMSSKASLDELFRLLNKYHNIQVIDFINELKTVPIWTKIVNEQNVKCNSVTTENYVKLISQDTVENNIVIVSITEYDYISKIFFARLYEGSFHI